MFYELEDGSKAAVTYDVLDRVSRPVLSVAKGNDHGQTFVFAPKGATVSRPGSLLHLQRTNDTFYLPARVLSGDEEESFRQIFPVVEASAGSSASSSSSGGPAGAAAVSGPSTLHRKGEDPNSRKALAPKIPLAPTQGEREQHNLSHYPFRSWCSFCVQGRAKDNPHRLSDAAEADAEAFGLPHLQIDFFFLSSTTAEEKATAIALTCCQTGSAGASGVPGKSKGLYVVEFILHIIGECGGTGTSS